MIWLSSKPGHIEVGTSGASIMLADRRYKPVSVRAIGDYLRVKAWRAQNEEKEIKQRATEYFRNKGIDPKSVDADLFNLKCKQIKLQRRAK